MNWALSSLDRFAIISNSDAHSPDKLGREATVFDTELSYPGLRAALAGGGSRAGAGILKTIEFFPQEGKYHYDGHRTCGVCLSPEEMRAAAGRCPVCGKPLTAGVLSRVMELADRPVKEDEPCPPNLSAGNKRPYHSLIPLKELLAELLDAGGASKKAAQAYTALIETGGSELSILMDRSLEELERLAVPGIPGPLLAAAIDRMRRGEVSISAGYDGEYGIIRAFPAGAVPNLTPGTPAELWNSEGSPPEAGLFEDEPPAAQTNHGAKRPVPVNLAAPAEGPGGIRSAAFIPDPEQERAVNHPGGPALIIAGPGTGKTSVLARRIARIIADRPEHSAGILALSFTVKAAEELRERIAAAAGKEKAGLLTAGTFHSLGRSILKAEASEAGINPDFTILDAEAREAVIKTITAANKRGTAGHLSSYIEERKRFLLLPGETAIHLGPGASDLLDGLIGEINAARQENSPQPNDLDRLYGIYRERLKEMNALDFDDLLAGTVRLLAAKPAALAKYRARFPFIFADEYQDSNFAQYALLRLLAGSGSEGGEICVIGDPNQAIYGFRGADKGYLDRFLRDYPGAAVYRLSRSFRCAGPIAQAANRLTTGGSTGAGIQGTAALARLYRSSHPSGKAEAEGIARQISALIGGTGFFALDSGVAGGSGSLTSLGQCAILLRAIALSPPFEEALSSHGIPYRLMGEDLEDVRWSLEEVALMTIHASKGLEFDQVFVPALEDGILPFTLFGKNSGADYEEERRLLYVAMTRARTGLHLSWANSRSFRGRQLTLPPSPFLGEIEKLIPEAASRMPRRDKDPQLNLFGE
jgi:superfamily I DNA/RNA helicase